MTKFLGGRAHMIEPSLARRDSRRSEQTGRMVKCPVCRQLLDISDLDEVLLHAHDVTIDSPEEDRARKSPA